MGECLIIRSGGGTDTSGATATANVILSGYTAYVNDELVTGSMPVQTLNQKLSPGGSVTLPAGYYAEGENVISVSTLAEATAANAGASHILSNYKGWVNGVLVNGSMANRGNVNQALGANGSYTIPAGWHAGGGKVTQSLATQGGTTVTPGTANKTACAANRWTTGNIVIAGSGNLTAGNIKNGITIFGIRGTFVGWVDSTVTVFDGNTGSFNSQFGSWLSGYNGGNYNTDGYAAYIMSGCKNRYGFDMDWVIYFPKDRGSHFVFKVPGVSGTTPNGSEFTLYMTGITDSVGTSRDWTQRVWYYPSSYSGSNGTRVHTSIVNAGYVRWKHGAYTAGKHTQIQEMVSNRASAVGTAWTGWVGIEGYFTPFISKIVYRPQ